MSVKLLTEHHLKFLSLKRGNIFSSETTLVKMPHCWKSHVTAQIYMYAINTSNNFHEELVLIASLSNEGSSEPAHNYVQIRLCFRC